MRAVKFPLVTNGALIEYPDAIETFRATMVGDDGYVYGQYSGDLPLEDSAPPTSPPANIAPRQMSPYAFMQLVGDANMIAILTAAKADPVVELLTEKLKQAEVVDFDDGRGGPQPALGYLLSSGLLTQSEYERIMRREFP